MSRSLMALALLLAPIICFGQPTAEEELLAAFNQDQSSRRGGAMGEPCGDETRRLRVLQLLAEGSIVSPMAKYYAAMILQHTPQGVIGTQLVSKSAENYLLAHFLAKAAADSGHNDAKWLSAATYDRYLVSQGLPQKYGTQFTLNIKTGFLEFSSVDPNTTDAERSEWNVPSLQDTLLRFEKSGIGEKPRASLTLAELSCSDPGISLP